MQRAPIEAVPWRDQLARRACFLTGSAAVVGAPVLGAGLSHAGDRVWLPVCAGTLGVGLLAAGALQVSRTTRSIFLVGAFVVFAWVGYVTVGPVPGPFAMVTVAVLLALLLLGRTALGVALGLCVGGSVLVGWATAAGYLPPPDLADTSPLVLRNWLRSIAVSTLALGALAAVVGWVVERIESAIANEREAAQRQLESEAARHQTETRALAAQRLELVGRLAAGLAHDVNNLLGVITVVAAQLPADTGPNVRTDIEGAASQASAMLRQLMVLSKGRTRTPAELSLKRLVEAASGTLSRLAPSSVTLSFELDGPAYVSAEEVQLHQVLLNLCVNALDAVAKEGGCVKVRTRQVHTAAPTEGVTGPIPAGDWALLEVQDDGVGMDTATQRRALEPFFTTKAPGQGTGLGLASVADIARQHHGHLTLESQHGGGTCIALWLPALKEQRA